MASGGVGVMEKPIQLQQQQQRQPQSQEALKCPRCDSSNTKFCYYNNYSLSQPRHFCKACKRYWTRGGTLRNVPVGGGCRKNKRVKRPIITTTTTAHVPLPPAANHQTNPNPNPSPNPDHNHNQIPSSTTTTSNSNHHLNPLFYGLLPQNPNYPRIFDSTTGLVSGPYDLLDLQADHINASAGLGFSGAVVANNHNSNLTTFSSYINSSPMYAGGSTTTCSSMASLLASSLINQQQQQQQQRFMPGFASYYSSSMVKDLKIEQEAQNRPMEWNNNNNNNNYYNNNNKNDDHHHHQMEEGVDHVSSSDPNSLLWDTNEGGSVWLDPTNNNIIGSSVPSIL